MKAELLHQQPIIFQIANSAELILEAKHLCHDVYLEVGFLDTPLRGRIIPHEFDFSSTYFVALNSRREVVGTIRLTQGGQCATLKAWSGKLYASRSGLIQQAINGKSFEISALAVREDYRSLNISWGLYKAVYEFSMENNFDYGIINMDCNALRSFEMFGWNIIEIGEPMHYMGSLTVPGLMPVKKQSERVITKQISAKRNLA